MKRRGRNEVCESCRHWTASAKAFFGPVVDRSVRGWCGLHVATTFASGHCVSHSERKPVRIEIEVRA